MIKMGIDLEAAARLQGGGIVNHLQDEGAASSHLDLPDVEAKTKQGLKERALPIGLAAQGDDLRDRELLPECDCRRLEAVVGFEPGPEVGGEGLGGCASPRRGLGVRGLDGGRKVVAGSHGCSWCWGCSMAGSIRGKFKIRIEIS